MQSGNIEIRTIRGAADEALYQELAGYCFKLPRHQTERIFPLPEAQSRALGAFYDGRLAAGIVLRRFLVSLFGEQFPMAGIGWVAAAPEYRNLGLIRELMNRGLAEAREEGGVLSALYPFSHRFYAAYGYASLGMRLQYRIRPEEIDAHKPEGRFERCELSERSSHPDELDELIQVWSADWDLAVLDLPSREVLSAQLAADEEELFLYRNSAGRADGFVRYRIENDREGKTLLAVSRLCWRNSEGFRALFEFLRIHRGQCEELILIATPSLPLPRLGREPRFKAEVRQDWMVRPLRIAPLLAARAAADVFSDKAEISVEDPLFPTESGRYLIEENRVSREPLPSGAADPVLELPRFGALLFGAITRREAVLAWGNSPALDACGEFFSGHRPLWLNEYF